MFRQTGRKKRGSKAVSPVISAVILMGTIIALVMVTLVFVNDRLWLSVAESDFDSAQQYMQAVGLQIDDVAWTMGRKETVRYSSSYGSVSILQNAINYTIDVKTQNGGDYQYFTHMISGVLLFNMPVSRYSLGDNYYQQIYPQSISNITYSGTSAPVARVFVRQMSSYVGDENFGRIAVTPVIRVMSSYINSSSSNVYYLKLYLPVIEAGNSHGSAQSITMKGASIEVPTLSEITSIKVTASFPDQYFDSSFFHFSSESQEITVPEGYDDAILELYIGKVETVLGVQN